MGIKEEREKFLRRIHDAGGDEAVNFVVLLRDCFMEGLARDNSDADIANMRVAEAYAQLVREGKVGLEAPDLYPSFIDHEGKAVVVEYHLHSPLPTALFEYMSTYHAKPVNRSRFDKGMRAVLENAADKLGIDYPRRSSI